MAVKMKNETGVIDSNAVTPLHVPELHGNEWKYVKECLDTGWVSSVGPFVERFEKDLAKFVGTKFAVATVNGTAAIHVSLLVAGVAADDEVLVPSLTFIAPANAVRYIGAWPVLIDVERKHWQMDADKTIDFLEHKCVWKDNALYNKSTGRRVKAILPVHILGNPVDMDPILAAAKKYNLTVIEDATESLGAKYKGRLLGTLGGIASFSFNGNKIITTGGGGMIVTDNEEWAKHAKYLTTQAKDDPIEYIHKETGYNYRLTNLLAAVGCAQLEQLPEFILAKRRTAANYLKALTGIPGITPMSEAEWAYSTFWLFTILVDPKIYGMDSRALMQKMSQANIQTRPLWQALHRSPSLANCGHFDCPVADDLNRMALSLPCSVGLKDEEFQRVIDVLTENKNAK